MRERMLSYILTQVPKEFRGKENWLGIKMSPHTPYLFINRITLNGIETNEGYYTWDQCKQPVISTIYQRLKLYEATKR